MDYNRYEKKRRIAPAVVASIVLVSFAGPSAGSDFRYLGEKVPGKVPVLFAPGRVSTDESVEFAPAFAPDGREFYFTRYSIADRTCRIMVMKYVDGKWTGPDAASFSGKFMTAEPCFGGGGRVLFFSSKRPCRGSRESNAGDIWMMKKERGRWGRPVPLPPVINTNVREGNPSVSARGNLYFHRGGKDADIYVALRKGDGFDKPVRLGCAINTSAHVEVEPLVAPDESYLIFYSCGREDRVAHCETAGDLYISFRDEGGDWTAARVMDRGISSAEEENWPALSPDGRYLFFSSSRAGMPGIYWVDASVIEDFR